MVKIDDKLIGLFKILKQNNVGTSNLVFSPLNIEFADDTNW